MALDAFFQWLQDTGPATAIREGDLWFPSIECVHVLALTMVIGSIAIVDLRLIGVASRDRPLARLTAEVLPVTWTAFAVAALTGSLLFSSNAVKYSHNLCFQAKMCLLLLAGANMLVFRLFTNRGVERWGQARLLPLPARVAGFVSLALWIAVVAVGRWIGFTMAALT